MTQQQVLERLEAVHDPHLPVSLRRMGMLREVAIAQDGSVTVEVVVPCLGCPAVELLRAQVNDAIKELDATAAVEVKTRWGAGWRREDIDPAAHPLLRQYGLQL